MEDLRSLPKVDVLSRSDRLAGYPERVRVEAARRAIDEIRSAMRSGGALNGETAEDRAVRNAENACALTLKPAINMSGVVLHTGLGRARLAPSVVEHLAVVARGHTLLELDEETGKRGNRQNVVRERLCRLTGAEDAFVVNNAAGAVVLALAATSLGRDVLLSRGQMVEIGGAFRMPEIVVQSGCHLVEVGCTNKTHLRDYERAISERTGAILRCHTSNYQIIGFTDQPGLSEIATLAHAYALTCLDDMGTGCIVDLARFGLPHAPTIQDSIKGGADVVTASGDKLLGGPQVGLIVGQAKPLRLIAEHPLARALRVDKLTLAALEATLNLYIEGRECEIPTLRYLSRSSDEVRALAQSLSKGVIAEGVTEIGGGSAPGTGAPTWRVGLESGDADALLAALRHGDPPIIGRIEDGLVWLDPRTLDDDEVDVVRKRLQNL